MTASRTRGPVDFECGFLEKVPTFKLNNIRKLSFQLSLTSSYRYNQSIDRPALAKLAKLIFSYRHLLVALEEVALFAVCRCCTGYDIRPAEWNMFEKWWWRATIGVGWRDWEEKVQQRFQSPCAEGPLKDWRVLRGIRYEEKPWANGVNGHVINEVQVLFRKFPGPEYMISDSCAEMRIEGKSEAP